MPRFEIQGPQEKHPADHIMHTHWNVGLFRQYGGVRHQIAFEVTGLFAFRIEMYHCFALAAAFARVGMRILDAKVPTQIGGVIVIDFVQLRDQPGGFQMEIDLPSGMGRLDARAPSQPGFAGIDEPPFNVVRERAFCRE